MTNNITAAQEGFFLFQNKFQKKLIKFSELKEKMDPTFVEILNKACYTDTQTYVREYNILHKEKYKEDFNPNLSD